MADVNFQVKKGLTVPNGSASSPSIIFDAADPNTGLYSPGADQLAISTNGTGRLYVDASGQVLDGDSAAGLSFARSVITANPSNSTESAVLQFRRGTTAPSSGDLGSIRFTDLSNYRGASIAASIESAWSAGVSHPSFLSFRTTNSGNTTESEKLRLTSDGKLGLGTSSPSQLFTVNGTGGGSFTSGYTNALARINATTNTAGEGAAIALTAIATKETAWIIAAEHTSGNNGDLAFYAYPGGAGYAERLRITAAGNVGIGTTAVDTTLHIQGANTLGRGQLYIQSTSGNFPRFVLGDSADATYLDVYADTSNQEVIRNTGSGGKHVWQINSSEAARIDSSRRLLVGTSTARTPQTYTNPLLQVESTSYTTSSASFIVNQNSNDDPSITLGKSRGTALGSNTVVQSGDALGTITFQGADGSGLIRGAAISAAVDGTPGANDMPGRLVFSTTADGASSPTERMRIQANGSVLFAATSESATSDTGVKIFAGSGEGSISQVFSTTAAGDTPFIGYSTGDGSYKYYFKGNGGLNNYSANNTNLSDEREKKNVENLGSTWDCLKHWELKQYHYNQDDNAEPKKYGVIAQQVEPFCPEVVTDWKKGEDEDGNPVMRLAVKEQQMMWMAIKALQEAQVRIEQLEADVALLKGA